MLKRLGWSFIILTGVIAGVGLLIMDDAINDLFPAPMAVKEPTPPIEGLDLVTVSIAFKECNLDARYMKIPESNYIFLICHDGRGTLYDYIPMLTHFNDMGVSAFIFDYRQNGLSTGSELKGEDFEKNMKEDVSHAYGKLLSHQWAPWKIVIYAMGLGAIAAADVVGDNECAAFVVEHAFPTASEVVPGYLKKFLMRDRFNLRKSLPKIRVPQLFLTGDQHPLLNPDLAYSLVEHPDDLHKVCVINGADDRPLYVSRPKEWRNCIQEFLAKLPVHAEKRQPATEDQRDGSEKIE